ncbi:MAG: hypothetical protein DMF08_10505 [Verrucomicrobia bacterium]|nr:MAG: hypothetical protein DMF08_10505 [Verrucomicrobiota bacterium]
MQYLGSARVSRAGFGVPPKRTLTVCYPSEHSTFTEKFAIATTRSPARGPRALPGVSVITADEVKCLAPCRGQRKFPYGYASN